MRSINYHPTSIITKPLLSASAPHLFPSSHFSFPPCIFLSVAVFLPFFASHFCYTHIALQPCHLRILEVKLRQGYLIKQFRLFTQQKSTRVGAVVSVSGGYRWEKSPVLNLLALRGVEDPGSSPGLGEFLFFLASPSLGQSVFKSRLFDVFCNKSPSWCSGNISVGNG